VKVKRFEHRSTLPVDLHELWRLHTDPAILVALTPSPLQARILDPGQGVANDSLVVLEVSLGPIRVTWHALHAAVVPGETFTDVALKSPFPFWQHQHQLNAVGPGVSELRDVVWFVPPGPLPRALTTPVVRLLLGWMFTWRHRRTAELLGVRGTTASSRPPLAHQRGCRHPAWETGS